MSFYKFRKRSISNFQNTNIGKDSPAFGLHEEIRNLEESLAQLKQRLEEANQNRDRYFFIFIDVIFPSSHTGLKTRFTNNRNNVKKSIF